MNTETTRRAVIAAALAGGVGGLAYSDTARDFLDGFAPLSGRVWDTTDRSLPESVANPYGSADLYRDDEGIPHIESNSEAAASYAVGYVQAFDRIFGMDLQRRMLKGELAEVVGDVMGVPDDDEFHTQMDFEGAAQATRDALEGSELEPLGEAYADGVNAAIENQELPVEFALLDYEPEEWTLTDSLLMEKNISWNLTGNFAELDRQRKREELGPALLAEIDPVLIDHDYPILREEDEGAIGVDVTSDDEPAVGPSVGDWLLDHEPPSYFGSNSWVVSGEHTSSGTPIMANDPHLLIMAPTLWYEQLVDVPDYTVRGFTFPGVPFVVIGANEHGAWGFTNSGADVTDCFTYDFDEEGRYRYGDEYREVERETKEVVVDGADNREVTVEKTVHGPLIERDGERVGIAWTGFSATRTVEAMYELNRSEGVDDVVEAVEKFDLPTQCLTYADESEAYYTLTGKIPIRETPAGEVVDGLQVFDGSEPEIEWPGYEPFGESDWDEGFIPPEELPQVRDPNYIGTANQRIADNPDHYIGYSYMSPERGKRIYDVLDEAAEADEPMDIEFHMNLQTDTRDERAALVVEDIVAAVEAADVGQDLESAAASLSAWDYHMDRDSEAALVFSQWLEQFKSLLVDAQLADTEADITPLDWVALTLPADSQFFSDRSRDETMIEALDAALSEIDEEGWETYGDWNTTREATHPFGDEVPFLNYPTRAVDGSPGTVHNFRASMPGQDFAAGASLRMIVQPGENSVAMLPGGNSGDYFSDHYDDQFDRFFDGEFRHFEREREGDLVTEFEEGDQ